MYQIIFFILVPFIGLLFEGIHRKVRARAHNRVGPPIWQPFYDVAKLFQKSDIKTQNINDIFFRTAPFFYFLAVWSLFLFAPFPLVSFNYDFILLIYVTILASAFYILAGASSDSPFGIIGAMRENVLMVCYETIFAIAVYTFIIGAGVISFGNYDAAFLGVSLPLAAFCLLATACVELGITPLDSSEASTEIMAGAGTEYGARNLAFMELAKHTKRAFFVFFYAMLFVGIQNLFYFVLASLAILFGFIMCEVTTPRYRLDQAFMALVIVLIIALVEFVRVSWGILI